MGFSTPALCLALLAASSSGTLFSDSACDGPLCVSALYDDQQLTVAYKAAYSGASVGWVGVGQGTRMAGANMMVGWPTSDGSVVLSQRTTSAHTLPTTTEVKAQPFAPDVRGSFSNASVTVLSWTFPVRNDFAQKQTQHIYAISPTSPSSADPSAPIARHNKHGFFQLDLTKRLSNAVIDEPGPVILPPGTFSATGSTGQHEAPKMRDLSQMTTRLFLAHMIIMSLAWFGLVPAGILIARYGRTLFTSKWFRIHRAVQAMAAVLITIGFALGVSGVHHEGGPHFDNNHTKCGLAMFILVCIQVCWGQLGHVVRRATGVRAQNAVHIVLGVVLFFGLALYQVRSGLALWMWRPPSGVRDVLFPVWFAVILAAWLAGLVFLPREVKAQRKEQAARRKSRFEMAQRI